MQVLGKAWQAMPIFAKVWQALARLGKEETELLEKQGVA